MPPKRPTLVITGATGFIGRHIASYFAARDWHVIALVRNIPLITKTIKPAISDSSSSDWQIFPISQNNHQENILYSKYDLASGEEAIIPDYIDAFIHAGYIKQETGVDAFRLNTESAASLLKTFREKKVSHNLFLSSLSADKNALSVYGRQKAAIEDLFLRENGTVIRAGLVLGDGGLFEAMRQYLKQKKLIPLFGNGKQPLQTVYIDDLVESIFQIIDRNLTGKFIVATDEAVPYKQFYLDLTNTLRKEPNFVRMPYWLASTAITLGNFFRMNVPVTKDNLLGLQQMKQVSSSSDLEKIGVKLRNYKESFKLLS
jgi:nucleoside-diphosphate-sugar epimerase